MSEHFLTNITKDKALLVELAACLCESSIVAYMDEPMPPEEGDDSAYAKNYERLVDEGRLGCVVGYNEVRDYSDFWAVYDRIEALGLESLHSHHSTVLYLLPFEIPVGADQTKIEEVREILANLEALLAQ